MIHNRRLRRSTCPRAARSRQLLVESLEARYALDGDSSSQVISAALPGGNGINNAQADAFRIVRNGANLDLFINSTLSQSFPLATTTDIEVRGSSDDDTLTIDYGGGYWQVANGLRYNANALGTDGPANDDFIRFTGNAGFTFARETYRVGATEDAGTWTFDPGAANGTPTTITFTGLEPADSDVPAAVFDVIMNAAANNATIENGGLLNGANSLRLLDNNATFETTRFANKTTARIMGQSGGDTLLVNFTTASAGLTTLEVYGHVAADVVGQPADDNAIETIRVSATAAGVTTNVFGDGGSDSLFVGSVTGLLNGVLGAVNVSGGAGTNDRLSVLDFASATADPLITLTATQITGIGPATITYGTLELLAIDSTDNQATNVHVLGTAAGTSTGFDLTFGAPTAIVTVGGTAAAFGNGTGTLANIAGPLDFNFNTGDGTLQVDNTGSATALNASITDDGLRTLLTGFAPAVISYQNANTSTLDRLDIRTGGGADTIAVNVTTTTISTAIHAGGGNNIYNISQALSAGNTFSAAAGNDTFNLTVNNNLGSFAGAPGVRSTAITSLALNGGQPADDSDNRDIANINDNSGVARTVQMQYQPTGVDVNNAFAIAIAVATMESLNYRGVTAATPGGADTLEVVGTAADDDLTIIPVSTSEALAFIGGNPFDGPPESFTGVFPGVAGNLPSTGPDIHFTGLTGSIAVNGGGSGAQGNRLYYYARSEQNLVDPTTTDDIFGFGAGIFLPGVGVGNAYDTIDVTQTTITNAGLATVTLTPASFVATNPSRQTLIVNGGDEAQARTTGPLINIADRFTVAASPLLAIQVNGGLPPIVFVNGEPQFVGDELVLSTLGDVTVYSDKATPPNVNIISAGGGLEVSFSSIERTFVSPTTGVVNLVGDNNNVTPQTDNFVVLGANVIDGTDPNNPLDGGIGEFYLRINGSPLIAFDNVQFLNAIGHQLVDTLDITAYADNTPRGWGIDIFYDEGTPDQSDGAQLDLLIYNTSANAGDVSEDIVIQPSGPENGELRVTHAGFGTPITLISYVNNLDIIVNDDDGDAPDTDSLTLRGTNPDTPQTSGNETINANFTAAGDVANPMVVVSDTNPIVPAEPILYRLRTFTGFPSINIETLAGVDAVTLRNRAGLTVNVDGGDPVTADVLTLTAEIGARVTQGVDAFTGFVDQLVLTAGGNAGPINYQNFAQLIVNSLTAASTLTIRGTDDRDTIAVQPLAAAAGQGRTWVNDGPIVDFNIAAANFSTVQLQGRFGADSFSIIPIANVALTIDGNDPTDADTAVFNGTTAANVFTFTPTADDAATIATTGLGTVTFTGIESILLDGQGGGDSLTVAGTPIDDATTVYPAGIGAGQFVSGASPAFNFRSFTTLTVNAGTGGFDQVNVLGTENADTITAAAAAITLAGNTVNFGAGLELLNLLTLGGHDLVNLTALTAIVTTQISGGDGDDHLTGTPGADAMFGGNGADTLIGLAGIDQQYGEAGNDILAGGGGNDLMYGGSDADTLIWNPGDANDLMEGGDGRDILQFVGAAGTDNMTISADGARLRFDRTQGNIVIDAGSIEQVDANNTITFIARLDGAQENPAVATAATGYATLVYNTLTNRFDADLFISGIAQANVTDSHIHVGAVGVNGAVIFAIGAGSGYSVEGGGLRRRLYDQTFPTANIVDLLVGNTYFNAHTVANGGGEIRGQIVASSGAPSVAGADTFTVNDLSNTGVDVVNVGLGTSTPADGALDTATVNGRPLNDALVVSAFNPAINPAVTLLNVAGLPYQVNIGGSLASENDALIVNGLGGNDTLTSQLTAATLVNLTLSGGEGNDILAGAAGNDTLLGGAGEDILSGGAGIDILDGGAGHDAVLIAANATNDIIEVTQTSATSLTTRVNATNDTDTLVSGTVEEARVEAGAGADLIRVQVADALFSGTGTALIMHVLGGTDTGAGDRLVIVDNGADDLTIYRKAFVDTSGTVTVGPGNAQPFENLFEQIETVQFVDEAGVALNTNLANSRLVVFKYDPYENNDDRLNATHVGVGQTLNVDPTIDPAGLTNPFGDGQDLPGDSDWYRVEADTTGTLDFQVLFTQIATITSSTRPGLPGTGNLSIELYDADGTLVVPPTFGTNDADDDERIRIPAVEGQVYFLRVFGATAPVVNTYSVSVINVAAPVPFDIELDDTIGLGTVNTVAANSFTANNPAAPTAPLSTVDGFYVGRFVTFTSGTLIGQRAQVTAYTGATRTFTFAAGAFTGPFVAGAAFQVESSDTGRSQFENVTRDSTPTILIRVPDAALLNDVPDNGTAPGGPVDVTPIPIPHVASIVTNAPSAGFRVAVFLTETSTHTTVLQGYAQPDATRPGTYSFTFPAITPDGSYFISSRVEMIDLASPEQAQGFGAFAQSLEIVIDTAIPAPFFGGPAGAIGDDGLHPDSDSGVLVNPATYDDRITSDTTPTLWGTAEANTVIRLYWDIDSDGVLDLTDPQIAQTVAEPIDGTNQFPGGNWEATSFVNLNDPNFLAQLAAPNTNLPDGLRRILATAEDAAGNVSSASALEIFVDTQAPVVDHVFVTTDPTFDLFQTKPLTPRPTPLVSSLSIRVRDLPARLQTLVSDFVYPALDVNVALTPSHYIVRGDFNGIIPVTSVSFTSTVEVSGQAAEGVIVLAFAAPLPDDRFTLTISDALVDPAGNHLDGETNGFEPLGSAIDFINPAIGTSGDGQPGGDFVVRFTVDSRAEVGAWAGASIWADHNGNGVHDTNSFPDFTNRDITYSIGYQPDTAFAGNFVLGAGGVADGFDKIATYGPFNGPNYRFLVDTDNDGVPDNDPGVVPAVVGVTVLSINGLPIAGKFDGTDTNGDEVGVFDGTRWYFDTNHNFVIDTGDYSLASNLRGYPVVGDFDGDGFDDLATWKDDQFSFDLANGVRRGWNGVADFTVRFGFVGVRERPVAADMDGDRIDDIGLWVPDRVAPQATAEWYWIVSGGNAIVRAGLAPGNPLHRVDISPDDNANIFNFAPVPFNDDLVFSFGDEFAQPIVGNFDPPTVALPGATIGSFANPRNPLDVNDDGVVSPLDALLVINELNASGVRTLTSTMRSTHGPFYDVSLDQTVSPLDALEIVNYLNRRGQGEGEGAVSLASFNASVVEDPEAASPSMFLASDSPASASTSASSENTAALLAYLAAGHTPIAFAPAPLASSAPDFGQDGGDEFDDLLDSLADDVAEEWLR